MEDPRQWRLHGGGKKDAVRFFRLFSALQDSAVSAFHREGGNLDHGVGARFKDHGDDADGTGDAVKAEPFIKLAGKGNLSHGIRKEMSCRMPLMLSASFPSSNASRFMTAGASPDAFAAARSIPLAANIFLFLLPDFQSCEGARNFFFCGCGGHQGRCQFHFCRFFFYVHRDSPLLFLIYYMFIIILKNRTVKEKHVFYGRAAVERQTGKY